MLVVVLAVLGLFPMAIVASAVLTPLLVILYLYDVDVYEDDPMSVIAFTMLWGVAAGIAAGLIAKSFGSTGASLFGESAGSLTLQLGVIMPLISVALMIIGPLFLLPRKIFNDVLDGATFGGAAAVCFAGAQLITTAWPTPDELGPPAGRLGRRPGSSGCSSSAIAAPDPLGRGDGRVGGGVLAAVPVAGPGPRRPRPARPAGRSRWSWRPSR